MSTRWPGSPARRVGDPAEVADAVAWLLSPGARTSTAP